MVGIKMKIREDLINDHPAIQCIKHPSRSLIIGRSQSGKTTLSAKILLWMSSQVDHITLCSPTADHQPTWQKVDRFIDEKYKSAKVGLKAFRDRIMAENYNKKSVLIIDDCSYEEVLNTGNKGRLAELFYNAVWYNISIILICHKVTNVCNAARENLENLVLFQQVTEEEKEKIFSTFSIDTSRHVFRKIFDKMIQEKLRQGLDNHPFLYIHYQGNISVFENFKCLIKGY